MKYYRCTNCNQENPCYYCGDIIPQFCVGDIELNENFIKITKEEFNKGIR